MKEVLLILTIAFAPNGAMANANEYPPHLECKVGLCKDEIYKRTVRIYCVNEEERNPALKIIEWGPYL